MIGITVDTKVRVASPYLPAFTAEARKLNGKWDGSYWNFDLRDEARVRAAAIICYGTDGTTRPETRDVTYTITSRDDNPLFVYGRKVAERFGRDARVKLGEGVIVIDGDFPSSCGSHKNPALTNTPVMVEIRDVPISLLGE